LLYPLSYRRIADWIHEQQDKALKKSSQDGFVRQIKDLQEIRSGRRFPRYIRAKNLVDFSQQGGYIKASQSISRFTPEFHPGSEPE
jgi:hypothetical protein